MSGGPRPRGKGPHGAATSLGVSIVNADLLHSAASEPHPRQRETADVLGAASGSHATSQAPAVPRARANARVSWSQTHLWGPAGSGSVRPGSPAPRLGPGPCSTEGHAAGSGGTPIPASRAELRNCPRQAGSGAKGTGKHCLHARRGEEPGEAAACGVSCWGRAGGGTAVREPGSERLFRTRRVCGLTETGRNPSARLPTVWNASPNTGRPGGA